MSVLNCKVIMVRRLSTEKGRLSVALRRPAGPVRVLNPFRSVSDLVYLKTDLSCRPDQKLLHRRLVSVCIRHNTRSSLLHLIEV